MSKAARVAPLILVACVTVTSAISSADCVASKVLYFPSGMADSLTCSGTDCAGCAITCDPSQDCTVTCTAKDGCKGMTLICPDTANCNLICDFEGCRGSTTSVTCPVSGNCDLTCNGQGCKEMRLQSKPMATGTVTVDCKVKDACKEMVATCPENGNCDFKCKVDKACTDLAVTGGTGSMPGMSVDCKASACTPAAFTCPTSGTCDITCDGTSACLDTEIKTADPSTSALSLYCKQSTSCSNAIVSCPGDCIVDCPATSSCPGIAVTCPKTGDCDIRCTGSSSCSDFTTTRPTGSTGSTTVACTASSSCLKSVITCGETTSCTTSCTLSGCREIALDCSSADSCKHVCDGSQTCYGVALTCPVSTPVLCEVDCSGSMACSPYTFTGDLNSVKCAVPKSPTCSADLLNRQMALPPDTDAPATAVPTVAPATTAPATTAPVTTAPATTAPATSAPATTAPATTAPATTAPATTAPATTAPATTAPATTAPATSAPATTAPATTAPATTAPATTAPATTAPATTAPATTAPATTAPATTAPATTAPTTAIPTGVPTSAPATASPPTAEPTVAPTSPPTAIPTNAPPTATPTALPTSTPTAQPTSAPATQAPDTVAPATPWQDALVPATDAPPNGTNESILIGEVLTGSARDAAKTAQSVATGVALATVSGTSLATTGRLAVLLNFGCQVEDVDVPEAEELDWEFHPATFGLGSDKRKYMLAATIMNPVIVTGTFILLVLLAGVIKLIFNSEMETALGNMRAPGLAYIPYIFLLQGTSLLAARMAFYPQASTSWTAVCGWTVLVGCCISPFIFYYVIIRQITTEAEIMEDPLLEKYKGKVGAVYQFVFGDKVWVSSRKESRFAEKYGVIFEGYRHGMAWFCLVEMFVTLGLSFLATWQTSDADQCDARNVLLCVLFGGFFIALIFFRPYLAFLDNGISAFVAGCMFGALLLMTTGIWSFSSTESWFFVSAAWLLFSSAIVVMAKCAWDISVYCVDIWLNRRAGARQQSRDIKTREIFDKEMTPVANCSLESSLPLLAPVQAGADEYGEAEQPKALSEPITLTRPCFSILHSPSENLSNWITISCELAGSSQYTI